MAFNEAEFLKRLQAAFQVEAEEHLQAMSAGLLELEKSSGPAEQTALIESVYREAHSLKGAARAVNFTAIESICQALESVFAVWKRGDTPPSPEAFDPIHNALDAIGQLTGAPADAAQDSAISARVGQLAREIDALARQPQAPAKVPTPLGLSTNTEARVDRSSPTNGTPTNGNAGDGPTAGQAPTGGHNGSNSYATVGNGQHPPHNGASPPEPTLHAPAPIRPVEDTRAEAPRPEAPRVEAPRPSEPARTEPPHADSSTETIRIATAKLDSLLRQAEEMVAVKLVEGQRAVELREVVSGLELWRKEWSKVAPVAFALRQTDTQSGAAAGNRVDESASMPGAAAASPATTVLDFLNWNSDYIKELQEKMARLSKTAERDQRTIGGLVDNLLDDSKKLLMLPFSSMLAVFPKLVRDVSRELGKNVDLVVHGGEVEIDKRILEEMKAPLVHLLRNSIDHGLETPTERVRLGKVPRGTIRIDIMQMGGQVEIVIADDGAGIDTRRVRDAAIRQGAAPEEINALSEREALGLIFRSDLSTSPTVTELSGRGLGMAIVREKVEKLGGQITLETQPEQGTTFRISLPLTLATFRGILVRLSDQIFVLPTAHVAMAARIKSEAIQTAGNIETISHYGRAVSLVHLADILELPRSTPSHTSDFIPVVILGSGDQTIAFSVDEVMDEQEVLIKSLGKPLVRVRNVEGVTVLGTGRVVPVLNVADLLKTARRPAARVTARPVVGDEPVTAEAKKRRTVLVAEDSITSRMLLKNILESAGYDVTTAVDGMDALTTLRAGRFDLVVSDIDMPRLTGLELTTAIRADARLGETPVVLVTARDSPEDRERGIDVGANAYVVKTSFDQSNLLDVVRQLV